MKPDPDEQVYYTFDGEQFGPVPFRRLKDLCAAGKVDPTADYVWWNGLPDWVTAGQVEGLFHGPPAAQAPASADTVKIPQHPKRARFALVLTLALGAFVLYVVGFLLVIVGIVAEEQAPAAIGGLMLLAAVPVALAGGIIGLIYLYRAWLIVQGSTARTTPGKAVGFLFIPLFNLYWVFQAYYGWAEDYNRFRKQYGLTKAPEAPVGLFLAVAILTVASVVPYIGMLAGLALMICSLMALYHLCKAINHFAIER